MRRIYLSPVTIEQTDDGPTAVCKAIRDYTHREHRQVVALNTDGTLRLPYGFCLIDTDNQSPLLADSELRALPDLPMDLSMSAMQPGAMATLRSALQQFLIDDVAIIGHDLSFGYRFAVRNIGRLLDPSFNENNFL